MTQDRRSRQGWLVGAGLGLLFGLLVMWVGLGWTIFLTLLVIVGGLVGSRIDPEAFRAQWDEVAQRFEQWWSGRGR
jgi:hypothetical protein